MTTEMPQPLLDKIPAKALELIRRKAPIEVVSAAVARLGSDARDRELVSGLDADGTLLPFHPDDRMAAPTRHAREGLVLFADATGGRASILSSRGSTWFVERMPRWGWTGVRVFPSNGNEAVTWTDAGAPQVRYTNELAKAAADRVAEASTAVKVLLQELGLAPTMGASGDGLVYHKAEGLKVDLQYLGCTDAQKANIKDLLRSERFKDEILDHFDLVLDDESLSSGTVQLKAKGLPTGKRYAAVQAYGLETEAPGNIEVGRPALLFAGDEGSDLETALLVKSLGGTVTATYNPPDDEGRTGTNLDLMEVADVIFVGSDVAALPGVRLSGFPDELLPQDAAGLFLRGIAAEIWRLQGLDASVRTAQVLATVTARLDTMSVESP